MSTWQGTRETGSDDYVARYDGVFGGSWVVEALAGLHQEEDFTTGPGKSLTPHLDTRPSGPDALSGGFGTRHWPVIARGWLDHLDRAVGIGVVLGFQPEHGLGPPREPGQEETHGEE